MIAKVSFLSLIATALVSSGLASAQEAATTTTPAATDSAKPAAKAVSKKKTKAAAKTESTVETKAVSELSTTDETTMDVKPTAKKKKTAKKTKAETAGAPAESEAADFATMPESEMRQPVRADGMITPGETLQFKIDPSDDGSRNGEVLAPMRFSAPDADFNNGKPPAATKSGLDDEAPFKAYIGYPKHQVGIQVSPLNLSSKWNYNGQDFNFKSSSVGYGLWYRLIATPLINITADWNRFTAGVSQGTVSGFSVADSDQTYDSYGVSGSYCFASKLSFFHRLCPGLKVANDSYPILEFTGGTSLEMGKVDDIVVGLTLDYQYPVVESVLLTAMAGYNYGTGVGNTGNLTSKENNAMYVRAGSKVSFASRHDLSGEFEFNSRTAKLKGLVGANKDDWETKSTIIGFRAAYGYTF